MLLHLVAGGEDSFVTFAECFELANAHKVDMVLLAGDLFHDNKPSRKALQRAMEIMRDHCFGDRKVEIEVVSDQAANFHTKYQSVNFEDPNYNVQLPVFSIHGNHDDPAGDGGLAALDLMSTANLINYFGRCDNFEKISLSPVLIQKGLTKLALYGLGHVRDERLGRCFERKDVRVARPVESRDEWFSILALHQNRMPRGAGLNAKGYIREQQLPSCMDLVIWGHEHECLIGGGMNALPESAENDFVVMQPGSTVATALVEGEARPKHVGLLSLCGDQWQLEPLPLRTVRPFIIREVALREHEDEYDLHDEAGLVSFLAEQVEAMIEEMRARQEAEGGVAHEETGAPAAGDAAGEAAAAARRSRAKLPLVRLKVDYGGFSTCNPQRFGQRFVDRVANPGEILLFQKTRVKRREEKERADEARRRARASGGAAADDDADDVDAGGEDSAGRIRQLMSDFLKSGKDALRLLPHADLDAAVFHEFVAKDNKNAIRNEVEASLKRMQAYLAAESSRAIDGTAGRKQQEEAIETIVKEKNATAAKVAAARATAGLPPSAARGASSGLSGGGDGNAGGGGGGVRGDGSAMASGGGDVPYAMDLSRPLLDAYDNERFQLLAADSNLPPRQPPTHAPTPLPPPPPPMTPGLSPAVPQPSPQRPPPLSVSGGSARNSLALDGPTPSAAEAPPFKRVRPTPSTLAAPPPPPTAQTHARLEYASRHDVSRRETMRVYHDDDEEEESSPPGPEFGGAARLPTAASAAPSQVSASRTSSSSFAHKRRMR